MHQGMSIATQPPTQYNYVVDSMHHHLPLDYLDRESVPMGPVAQIVILLLSSSIQMLMLYAKVYLLEVELVCQECYY